MNPRPSTYQEYRSAPPAYVHYPAKDRPEGPEPTLIKWSGDDVFVPALGATVRVRINQIGHATVTGYFVEDGYLGLLVRPIKPPPWYVKQNGRDAECHVFGAEIVS